MNTFKVFLSAILLWATAKWNKNCIHLYLVRFIHACISAGPGIVAPFAPPFWRHFPPEPVSAGGLRLILDSDRTETRCPRFVIKTDREPIQFWYVATSVVLAVIAFTGRTKTRPYHARIAQKSLLHFIAVCTLVRGAREQSFLQHVFF